VSFLAPDPGDRGEPDIKQGAVGGSAVGEHKLVANGMEVLARGALACPRTPSGSFGFGAISASGTIRRCALPWIGTRLSFQSSVSTTACWTAATPPARALSFFSSASRTSTAS
jgi:hypothetical protein